MPRQDNERQRLLADVAKMVQRGQGRKDVAQALKVSVWEARQLITQARVLLENVPVVKFDATDPQFRSILLRQLNRPRTTKTLAGKLNVSVEEVEAAITDLEERGYIVTRVGHTIQLGKTVQTGGRGIHFPNHFHGKPMQFGVVSDMHIGNKHSRLDVLEAAYDEFARRKIKTVFCPGNYVDGEARFNTHELVVHGFTDQALFAIDNWPQRKGITTYYVDGDDHEGWYYQREGVEFGRYLYLEAKERGRDDLQYLGYLEADVLLQAPNGDATIKIMHPGGGSAYAISYSAQKMVESLQGGSKPAILLLGHTHKWDYCVPLDSEILTRQGWRMHDSLRVGQDVLAYNLDTDTLEWVPLLRINLTPPTPVDHFENTVFSVRCTPDHKWAWEHEGRRFLSPLGSAPARAKLIQAAKGPDGPGIGKLSYSGLLDREAAIDLALRMTSAERQAFVYGLLVGEGSINGRDTIQFNQNPGPINDAFLLASFLEGWAPSRSRKHTQGRVLSTAILRKRHRDYRIRDQRVARSLEPAWCPTTRLGTWVMRQNGQITITGNCYPRNVHTLQCGTVCDQSLFMRKKKLEAHVGFVVCTFQQDINGGIVRFVPEWFPFFDKRYYQLRDDLQKQMVVGE